MFTICAIVLIRNGVVFPKYFPFNAKGLAEGIPAIAECWVLDEIFDLCQSLYAGVNYSIFGILLIGKLVLIFKDINLSWIIDIINFET